MRSPSASAAAALVVMLLTGCSRQPAPPPQMSRVDSIIQKTGGDWRNLSPEDRDYMIRTIGKGSPVSAEMTFRVRAGMRPGGNMRH